MTPQERPESEHLAEVLLEYVRTITRAQGADGVLAALYEFCTRFLDVYGVGMLVVTDDGRLEVMSANTDIGQRVEQLEADLQEGPCTDAARSGRIVVSPDLREAVETYPRFAPAALEIGVRAIHALPIHHGGQLIGSLDVVSDRPGRLDPVALSTTLLLVEVAAAYIANSRALADQTLLTVQLQTALESRSVIEQAKGIVSIQHDVPVEEAFERIRRYARSNQRRLKDVASEVVERRLELPQD